MGLEHNPLLLKDILKIVQDILDKLSHEDLQELLGGDENGHYHLTEDELKKLVKLLIEVFPDGKNLDINHERLKGLLGGNANGHYHLTTDELNNLKSLIQSILVNKSFDLNHEALRNLLGGDANGHYHLTSAERSKLIGLPSTGPTVKVGTTTTGAAGTAASVTNSGTATNAVFNFTIPRGATETKGTEVLQVQLARKALKEYREYKGRRVIKAIRAIAYPIIK